ncbi:acyl carrier protein [Kosakonia quasisacchari]|uniref:Acyl carrier protein n=2 Tax=Enterobacteriaceae TaxID=543 RepID=A0A4R0H519_9ENTR|nr:acyl carrier protein [Kosakonia quasisacchari]TCC04893.1 acyl carrier protein [Kosakonia quasisacchari]
MNMYTELYNAIATTIADAKDLPLEEINEQTTISELELDSLDYVELMVLVKKEFNITINFEATMKSTDITLKEFCVSVLSA